MWVEKPMVVLSLYGLSVIAKGSFIETVLSFGWVCTNSNGFGKLSTKSLSEWFQNDAICLGYIFNTIIRSISQCVNAPIHTVIYVLYVSIDLSVNNS